MVIVAMPAIDARLPCPVKRPAAQLVPPASEIFRRLALRAAGVVDWAGDTNIRIAHNFSWSPQKSR
jgi:hypothetical protein